MKKIVRGLQKIESSASIDRSIDRLSDRQTNQSTLGKRSAKEVIYLTLHLWIWRTSFSLSLSTCQYLFNNDVYSLQKFFYRPKRPLACNGNCNGNGNGPKRALVKKHAHTCNCNCNAPKGVLVKACPHMQLQRLIIPGLMGTLGCQKGAVVTVLDPLENEKS